MVEKQTNFRAHLSTQVKYAYLPAYASGIQRVFEPETNNNSLYIDAQACKCGCQILPIPHLHSFIPDKISD